MKPIEKIIEVRKKLNNNAFNWGLKNKTNIEELGILISLVFDIVSLLVLAYLTTMLLTWNSFLKWFGILIYVHIGILIANTFLERIKYFDK